MSAFSSNPFVLPGLGQSGEAASNPLLASMEMMRQAFAGLTGPGGVNPGLQLTQAMDPQELEKKIADLRTVENWLKLNLSMLSSTIKGMEVQHATIVTLKSFVANATNPDPAAPKVVASPLEVVLGLRPDASAGAAKVAKDAPEQASTPEVDLESKSTANEKAQDKASNMSDAAQAWWNMLQQQFGQVAQATAATMAASSAAHATPTKAVKKAVKKSPRKSARKTVKSASA